MKKLVTLEHYSEYEQAVDDWIRLDEAGFHPQVEGESDPDTMDGPPEGRFFILRVPEPEAHAAAKFLREMLESLDDDSEHDE